MKSQRVLIRVLVANDGSFAAGGYHDAKGAGVVDLCWVTDALPMHVGDNDYHEVWVEADVPLPPEPPIVEGKVTEKEK